MDALYREVLSIRKAGQSCVLATIIHTRGSVPSYQSSRMLVREDGTLSGTVGGGCVEADVWAAARKLLEGAAPRKLHFDLNADPRQNSGLTCGGTLEIFLDLVTPESDVTVFEKAADSIERQRSCVLATVVDATGEGERLLGNKIITLEDGSVVGNLGRTELTNTVIEDVSSAFGEGRPRKIALEDSGTNFEIAIEPILAVPECILLGAGHVGQQVALAASAAGFRVAVADDRSEFANRERFPTADRIHASEWDELFSTLKPGPQSYIVIVTRGHKEDMTVLRWAVTTQARYVGLIGSKRKVLSIFSVLEEEGISRSELDRVHAPIGLEIGALTPEEIAVSIVAELIAIRRGSDPNPTSSTAPVSHSKMESR